MLNVALRLVEGGEMDREKALEAAISQIERNRGKGSITRLGQNEKAVEVEAISTGSLGSTSRSASAACSRGRVVEIYGPDPPARPRSRCMSSPRRRSAAAFAASSTPSTRSTPSMRGNSVSISKTS